MSVPCRFRCSWKKIASRIDPRWSARSRLLHRRGRLAEGSLGVRLILPLLLERGRRGLPSLELPGAALAVSRSRIVLQPLVGAQTFLLIVITQRHTAWANLRQRPTIDLRAQHHDPGLVLRPKQRL